ncbi:MAG: hypothetical protein KGY60_09545 [Bacteroidales bacterium]|nr:hypothetical protein [Bacteroidales bacterium]
MKKNAFSWLFLLTFVLLLSCNPQKKALRNMMEGCDTLELSTTKSPGASGDKPLYTSDALINKAAEAFTISSLQENHSSLLSLRKEPFQNIHDTSRIDTIYHFSGKRDSIKFYRSQEKDLMIYLSIADPKLDLHRCVRPGMSKDAFLDLFDINPPVGDTIRIANPDQTLIFIFYFQQDKLQRIRSDIYFG